MESAAGTLPGAWRPDAPLEAAVACIGAFDVDSGIVLSLVSGLDRRYGFVLFCQREFSAVSQLEPSVCRTLSSLYSKTTTNRWANCSANSTCLCPTSTSHKASPCSICFGPGSQFIFVRSISTCSLLYLMLRPPCRQEKMAYRLRKKYTS